MPELNIPESIKKPEIVMPSFIMGSMDEIAASVEEERKEKEEQQMNHEEEDFDFNLEDTILAAASAQGIDIPDKTEEEETLSPQEEEPFVEEKKETEEIAELEEEPMTEEDLQRAEEEFRMEALLKLRKNLIRSFSRIPFRRKARKSLLWKSFTSQRKKSWSSLLIP